MRIYFSQACLISLALHGTILFISLPQRRSLIRIPLTVELVKIFQPVTPMQENDVAIRKEQIIKKKIEIKKENINQIKSASATPQMSTQINLEAVKFPYMYYLTMIRKKVASQWDWPQNTGIYQTIVYFKIFPSGYISDTHIDKKSRSELFDQAAVRAVQLANPFSPLPGGFTDDYLGVYFEFSFK